MKHLFIIVFTFISAKAICDENKDLFKCASSQKALKGGTLNVPLDNEADSDSIKLTRTNKTLFCSVQDNKKTSCNIHKPTQEQMEVVKQFLREKITENINQQISKHQNELNKLKDDPKQWKAVSAKQKKQTIKILERALHCKVVLDQDMIGVFQGQLDGLKTRVGGERSGRSGSSTKQSK